ncbi:MAG TPA: 2,3-bisphosphoglycerate-independent phosphoglycerate mutase [Gemmatales bacterium]|nr:2,3-bisphosphoglycerate-independent phosphoglycerate mutase [Gemmatales bacterium]
MRLHDLVRRLREPNTTKIVMLVADGLGGLPLEPGGKTELEAAHTPQLDAAAREGVCGLSVPVLPGITPGSGPGHLGLFGYDPLEYQIGRGVLEALGINFPVGPQDVAIRGNFCTIDEEGLITDRRAGRPSTERCIDMCGLLRQIGIPNVELFVEPVREHRFVLVIRAADLGDHVNDTDPQGLGLAPLTARGADPASERTAEIVNQFVAEAARVLRKEAPTNMVTLRGFARYPNIATMEEIYGLRSVAIAVYPMYKGLARLVGMTIAECGSTLEEQIRTLEDLWEQYDFFFLHYKYTDSTGEDGNFMAKVQMIEKLDEVIPAIQRLGPDVFIVTGDHSTPSKMRSHSWHPVPTLLVAEMTRTDGVAGFSEAACLHGGLGHFEAKYLMLHALAHARRLGKYGA